jgi:hypothetical protein
MLQAFNTLIGRLQEASLTILKVPDAGNRRPSAWYVGMAIAPEEFSQQLVRLQGSLQRETAPVAARIND